MVTPFAGAGGAPNGKVPPKKAIVSEPKPTAQELDEIVNSDEQQNNKRTGAPSDAQWDFVGLTPTEDLPDGSMAVAEVSYNYLTVSRGIAVVYDEEKYAIYTFWGGSMSYPAQLPIGYTYTYGTVTNVREVEDYSGDFLGAYSGCLNTFITGSAWALNSRNEWVIYDYEGGILNGLASGAAVSNYKNEHTDWYYYNDMLELPFYDDEDFYIMYRENVVEETWEYFNRTI